MCYDDAFIEILTDKNEKICYFLDNILGEIAPPPPVRPLQKWDFFSWDTITPTKMQKLSVSTVKVAGSV